MGILNLGKARDTEAKLVKQPDKWYDFTTGELSDYNDSLHTGSKGRIIPGGYRQVYKEPTMLQKILGGSGTTDLLKQHQAEADASFAVEQNRITKAMLDAATGRDAAAFTSDNAAALNAQPKLFDTGVIPTSLDQIKTNAKTYGDYLNVDNRLKTAADTSNVVQKTMLEDATANYKLTPDRIAQAVSRYDADTAQNDLTTAASKAKIPYANQDAADSAALLSSSVAGRNIANRAAINQSSVPLPLPAEYVNQDGSTGLSNIGQSIVAANMGKTRGETVLQDMLNTGGSTAAPKLGYSMGAGPVQNLNMVPNNASSSTIKRGFNPKSGFEEEKPKSRREKIKANLEDSKKKAVEEDVTQPGPETVTPMTVPMSGSNTNMLDLLHAIENAMKGRK